MSKAKGALYRSAAALAAIMAGCCASAAPITIPSSDDFESYATGTSLTDGINGWYASSNSVIVQDSIVHGGLKAAMIPPDCYLSNRFEEVSNSNIWARMYIRPTFDNASRMADYDLLTNSTAFFYFNTSGYCVVYNGTNGWEEISTKYDGSPATPVSSGAWARVDLRLNYARQTWELYINYETLRTNLLFASTNNTTTFSGFDVHGPGVEQTNYLDDVTFSYLSASDFATLAIDTTNVTRTIIAGQNVPSNSFNVWNSSNSSALYFTNTIVFSGAETNWLSISPSNDVSHGELKNVWLVFNTTNLLPSATPYEATVRIDATDGLFGMPAVNTPQTLHVAVYVNNRSVLWVSTNALGGTISQGYRPPDQEFSVANKGDEPRMAMPFTVSSSTNWIQPSPLSGSVVDETNTISLTYGTEDLPPGWHMAQVTVAAAGVSNHNITVSMRVNARPGIAWNADQRQWTNTIVEGGTVAECTFDVWNGSAEPRGTLRFEIASDMGWLALSPLDGVSSGEHAVVSATYSVSNLAAGVYNGIITVTGIDDATGAAATNSPLTMPVSLTVRGRAALGVDPVVLDASVLEDYGATSAPAFNIWNAGGEPRGSMNYTISSQAGFLSLSQTSGTVAGDTNSISVVWHSADLSPGTHTGYILVDAFDQMTGLRANGAPKTISVQLTVAPRTPVNFEKPTIYGTPHVLQTVSARNGLWQNMHRLTFTYQWQRADSPSGAGLVDIAGETTSNHMVIASEKGKYLRIAVTATDANPRPLRTTAYSDLVASAKVKALYGDFNGDGITDLWFFDPMTGMWRASFTATAFAEGLFGGQGMIEVPGDYNGDGNTDLAVYDTANGMWYALLLPFGTVISGSLFGGIPEECEATPVPQDYDGDGQTDAALYWRGYWAILYSAMGRVVIVPPITGESLSDQGVLPAPCDYDGDGIYDLAVYNAGLWTIRDVLGREWSAWFGSSAWIPAPADYDGDSIADLCIYHQGSNLWKMVSSFTGTTNTLSFGSSLGNNVPRQGYYDRDRYCDPATLHYSADGDFLIWCVTRSMETNFPYRGQSYQKSINNWRVSW